MPRVCTICTHDQRLVIDQALVTRADSYRRIAAQFDITEQAIRRHKAEHMPVELTKAQAAEEVTQADDLLAQVTTLQARALSLLDSAERAGDLKTALMGVREARGCLELLAKLKGQLDDRPVVNVLIAPQWIELRSMIITTLAPYPEARTALAAALQQANA